MSSYVQTKRFLTRCPMCGSPTYRLYSGTSEKEFVCFNCNRIFVQKEKLHPRITERKSLQVHQFQEQGRFVSRFLSLFFVGFGFLWRGHALKGILYLFFFFIFVLRFFYWNGVIFAPIAELSPNIWRTILWGGLFIIFYLVSIRQVYRLKPRLENGNKVPDVPIEGETPARGGGKSSERCIGG